MTEKYMDKMIIFFF